MHIEEAAITQGCIIEKTADGLVVQLCQFENLIKRETQISKKHPYNMICMLLLV